jgi:hypothetical protein
MRIRTIKPEFWTDKKVATWSHFTRLFFIGLWSASDDYGRGSAEPARIAAELFPYELSLDPSETLARVSESLDTLSRESRIVIYENHGETYYEITNWSKHQKVDNKGKARIPTSSDKDSIVSRESLARVSRVDLGSRTMDLGSIAPDEPDAGGDAGVEFSLSSDPPTRKPRAPKPESDTRERNPLFDALASISGADPKELTTRSSRSCGVALAEIRRATPTVTPEEIKRRAENYRMHFASVAITPSALANHWATCANPPTVKNHGASQPNSRSFSQRNDYSDIDFTK